VPDKPPDVETTITFEKQQLQALLDALSQSGYTLMGPTLRQSAVVYDEIHTVHDLPIGCRDRQTPASYRLERRDDDAYFGHTIPAQGWKKFLFPPRETLYTVERHGEGFSMTPSEDQAPTYAFIGVRACDLAAIAVQDRVFLGGPFQDPGYQRRRQQTFVLVVQCTEPGGTCFCASMGTGPRASGGFDLALTELADVFVARVGSPAGSQALADVDWRAASDDELQTERRKLDRAENSMGRQLDTSDLPELLYHNLEHPRWDDVAQRCLSCTNCTQVCPTCFCNDIIEVSDLHGRHIQRVRQWDSCYSLDFSHVHGGNIRPTTRSRYRQWLTHKVASWIGQFGVSGCVGCGRCITWCPVGIDLTVEIEAIRMEEQE
jgi:ferredoxin